MKEKVVEKKLSDPEFVNSQLSILKKVLNDWDVAKGDYDKIRMSLKNAREQYQDLHLD